MKRIFDVLFSLSLLIFLMPLLLVLLVAIAVLDGRPIIFSQDRVGRGGRVFRFHKFRTMHRDAEAILAEYLEKNAEAKRQWDLYQKIDVDPRVTVLGRFLRRSSLDELPQLWNVVVGDMSIVGPRPCLIQQVQLYGACWDEYISVRPGLTGLWQVSGRNELTFADRVRLDSHYVKSWSLALDFRILFQTLGVVISGRGSK